MNTPNEITTQAQSPFAIQAQNGALAAITSNAATTQVLASIWIAKQFPRNLSEVTARVNQACSRLALAQAATYAFPRKGTTVEGPSIRLAEALLSAWGNAEAGWKEVTRRFDTTGANGRGCSVSECVAYCFDKETNTRREISFSVPHIRDKKTGGEVLTSERDIYELCANMASRRIRACILQVLPGWLTEEALEKTRETLERGDSRPMADIVRSLEAKFMEYGVTREQLEINLGHKIEETTRPEIVRLGKAYNSIADGMVRVRDVFPPAKTQESEPVDPVFGVQQPGAEAIQPRGSDVTCYDEDTIPGLGLDAEPTIPSFGILDN